jgi:NADH:ubiquinone oxidoreductase subunit H
VHFLAPVLLVVAVFMGFAVLPMGRNMVLVDMDAGLLFFFAIGASTELSVFMAGWSSRNKYSLLGAMRAVAQMISYEVPLLMSSVAVVMITGSLSLDEDRGGAEPVHVGLAALVHLYAVGSSGICDVCHRGYGGDQSLAL